ncbi:hypothetical protein F7725_011441 [Dissostichus mawsoni]|uniref:G-protein coupled receptors family 1 profile domain-containing protein n=1 Tax=Dissostichus mawsoni TaxID=36200 RepID=A0A7J5Z9G3_DISMA|nr:hypothetical protein F7725_011441 [Dissostichus mawsoni]
MLRSPVLFSCSSSRVSHSFEVRGVLEMHILSLTATMIHSSSIRRFLLLVLLGLLVAFVHTDTVADSSIRDTQDTMSGEPPSDVTTKDPNHDTTEQSFTFDYEDNTHSPDLLDEQWVLGPGAISAIVIAVFLGASVLLALIVITLRNGSSNSMTSNCSFEGVDHLMRYLELTIYIPIFLVGLFLNVAALLVFCVFLRKWTESTIHMTSLALMDLLLLFPLPFKMHATRHDWPADLQPLCSVLESLYFVGIYGSIYTIMCIALDRWVAICHPYKAKVLRSPKLALGTSVGVWVLVLAAVSPPSIASGRPGRRRTSTASTGWSPLVIICLQVFGFLLPALVVVYCSVKTIWVLQKSGKQSPQSRACVKIIYSSLSAFLLPFTPSHLGILLQFLVHQGIIQDCGNQTRISLFLQTAMCLSNVTCCLDALCYYFIAHEVRSTKHSFRRSMINQRRATVSTSEF